MSTASQPSAKAQAEAVSPFKQLGTMKYNKHLFLINEAWVEHSSKNCYRRHGKTAGLLGASINAKKYFQEEGRADTQEGVHKIAQVRMLMHTVW